MKYGVGIDISKGKSTVAILSIAGEVRTVWNKTRYWRIGSIRGKNKRYS